MRQKKQKHSLFFIAKEIILGLLGLISISLVIYEFFNSVSLQAQLTINHIDIVIACLFLTDFLVSISLSHNRKKYFRRNWYFLLAAIPLTDTIAQSLHGFRVFGLLRLVRAGEHLNYGITERK